MRPARLIGEGETPSPRAKPTRVGGVARRRRAGGERMVVTLEPCGIPDAPGGHERDRGRRSRVVYAVDDHTAEASGGATRGLAESGSDVVAGVSARRGGGGAAALGCSRRDRPSAGKLGSLRARSTVGVAAVGRHLAGDLIAGIQGRYYSCGQSSTRLFHRGQRTPLGRDPQAPAMSRRLPAHQPLRW